MAVPPQLKLIDSLQAEAVRNPNDRLEALISELEELPPDRPRAATPDTSASPSRCVVAPTRASFIS
jgi:hypothetical protein